LGPGQLAYAQGAVMCGALFICGWLSLLAEPLMRWWLGPDIARTAAGVLLAGVVGSGLIATSALAMLVVNSRGLTRPVALLHLVEMPLYLGCLYWAAGSSSLGWLLAVWLSRLTVDALAMTRMALRCTADETSAEHSGTSAAPHSLWPWILVLTGLCAISAISWSSLQAAPLPALQQGVAVATGLGAAALAAGMFLKRLRLSTGAAHRNTP
jgi:hypothetical protein